MPETKPDKVSIRDRATLAFRRAPSNLKDFGLGWLLFPMSSRKVKVSLLGLLAFNSCVQVGTAHLLPDLDDVAQEYNIKPETLKLLNPYGKVFIETDSLLSQAHAYTSLPGLAGALFHSYYLHRTEAYTRRAHIPFSILIEDKLANKLGSSCVLNLQKNMSRLRGDQSGPLFDENNFPTTRATGYFVIFHEIRHCAENQHQNPHHEMDAQYLAEKAMEKQFGINVGHSFEWIGFRVPEYDYTLYKDFLERGLPMPSPSELIAANKEAYAAIESLNERARRKVRKMIEDGTLTIDQDTSSAPETDLNALRQQHPDLLELAGTTKTWTLPDDLTLSPLAARRVIHYKAAQYADMSGSIHYSIDANNTVHFRRAPVAAAPVVKMAAKIKPAA